jgi:two-component system, chemotaxis family, sensor kinase CheA
MADMLDDETLQIFLEEARDHLADIETDLVAIESDGGAIDSDLVNKVFRGIHSIKGGAGFFGLERLKSLAHVLENTLNKIRNEELSPTREVVSAMLQAADVITTMIADAANSNNVDISAPLKALKEIDDARPSSFAPMRELSIHEGQTLFHITDSDIERHTKGGKYLYILEYDLVQDIDAKGSSPWQLFSELEKTGFLIETHFAISNDGAIEASIDSVPFFALFATVLDSGLMEEFTGIPSSQIHIVHNPRVIHGIPAQLVPPPPTMPDAEIIEQKHHVEGPSSVMETSIETSNESSVNALPKNAAAASPLASAPATSSLRVNVKVLDTLMTLAGELVLARNQLMQKVASHEITEILSSSQSLSLIISELQEAVMSTRMQPLSNVFGKFHRIVRDLSQELGKNIQLDIEGEDVELDKTVIESISDPLTHLIRNSVDHGIELPSVRHSAGKPAVASIRLHAYHEAGKVVIEIRDDGKGIDVAAVKRKALERKLLDSAQLDAMSQTEIVNLIFLPGFSTAATVTDISGRGVGMDVVRTNFTKLGGVIDIDTNPGIGTTFRVKLPLTLAIIPSLMVSVNDEIYAIPQVNLVELVRVPAAEVRNRIERIGEALVMRLRGKLLPLVRLSEVLKLPRNVTHPETGERISDRRERLEDRRGPLHEETAEERERRTGSDRRFHSQSAVSIAVLSAGDFQYGLIVDKLHESEEIVVKPLGRHFSRCSCYAGATILGDGQVALILDVIGVMRSMKLTEVSSKSNLDRLESERNATHLAKGDIQSFLLFKVADTEQFAVPLSLVSRIELIESSHIESTGGKRSVQYRGGSLPLLTLDQVAKVGATPSQSSYFLIVFAVNGKEIGLQVSQIVDVLEVGADFDEVTFRQPGILGSAIMNSATTLLVDLYGIVKVAAPEWLGIPKKRDSNKVKVLIADDSPFYLRQISQFATDAGFDVLQAHDGREAFEIMEREGNSIHAILTDVEMPNMDGLELTRRVRKVERWSKMPIIAITSMTGDEAMRKGLDAGVDRYIVKLDRERIVQAIEEVFLSKER